MNIPLPHDIEAEKGFLSSAMQDQRVIAKVAEQITSDHFYLPAHQTIWSTVNEMWLEKKPIDMLTVISSLRSSDQLDKIGGDAYLAEVYTIVYTSANWESYYETVKDCFLRRKILSTCQRMMNDAVDRSKDPVELQEMASKDIVAMSSTKTDVKHIGEVLNSCINRWEEAAKTGGAVNRGHSSGFIKWDIATRGFRPRTLHIIAGAAKAGKTTSSLQMVTNSAFHNNIPVAIISMEMAAEELVDKYIAATSQVALGDLLDGKLKNEDHKRLSNAIAKSSRLPIYIVDEASMTVAQFKARCRRLVTEQKVEIIMVDYAQLMEASGDPKNREREVAEVSRTAKIISKELNVCIVLLAQLNENGSVRESRTFYMDCDSFTKVIPDDEKPDDPYAYLLHVTHNRHGGTPAIPFKFVKHQARFEELP